MNLRRFLLPQRINISIMGFLAIAVAYTMRACLSVAIVEMVISENDSKTMSLVPYSDGPNNGRFVTKNYKKNGVEEVKFNWTEIQQQYILGSFYAGYIITHLPGGLIAERYGAKWTLSLGILSTAIFTLLEPVVAMYGDFIGIIVLRVLMGLGEGTTFPALSTLLAAWIPLKERSKLGAFVFGGGQIGSIISFFISSVLAKYFIWNWVFYFWGVISIVWFILFSVLCYNDPASDPIISNKERAYLQREIGRSKRSKTLPSTPWKDMIKSIPVLCLICAQLGHDWGFYIMVSDLPKYMKDVLKYDTFEVGLYSSLPYIAMWIVSVASGILSDCLITRRIISITFARKMFTAIAAIFPGIFIIGASYSGDSRLLVVGNFVLAMGFMGTFYPGMKVNPLDLSPNYAGSLMALTNGIGAFTGIGGPLFVGYMTPTASLEEWRVVFWVTFGIFVVTTIIYCIGASAEIQLWNYPKEWIEPEAKAVLDKDENTEKRNNEQVFGTMVVDLYVDFSDM